MFRWMAHLKGAPVSGNDRHYVPAVPVGLEVYVFQGSHKNHSDQMCIYVFNTVSLRWRDLPPVTTGKGSSYEPHVPRLWGHTAVLIEDTIYIWGGCSEGFVCRNDLYAFDVDTHGWLGPEVSGTVPRGREHHSVCVSGKIMYVCGGYEQAMRRTYDLYKLDTATLFWSLINARGAVTPPPVELWHSAAIIGTKMFVFEGDSIGNVNLLRVFDTAESGWLSCSALPDLHPDDPGQRMGFCHSAFSYNGELYVFCFITHLLVEEERRFKYFDDLLRLDTRTFGWEKVEPRGEDPGWWYQPCCCLLGDRVVVFGGARRPVGSLSDDLCILDLSPSLKTLCKLVVIQTGLERSELPHGIRWELAVMTGSSGVN